LLPPILRQRNFRNFWLGQSISVFGDQITLLAIPVVAALVLNASPADMGLLTAAGLLPHLLFSLPAGVWLDRIQNRRRLMIVVDIGRALLILTIPLAYVAGILGIEQLFLVTFLVGCLAVLFDIAWNTLFVAVTPRSEFVSANSLLNGSRSLAYVAGPAIGGVMMSALGAPLAIIIDGLSYLASGAYLTRVDAPEPPIDHEPGSIRSQLAAGVSFVWRDSIIRPTLVAVAWVNLFNLAYHALFVLYATTHLGIDPAGLGLVLGAAGIGGVIGVLFAARVGRRIGIGPAYAAGLILFPAPLILVPLASGPTPLILLGLFVAEFLSGFGVMILDVNAGVITKARTPDIIRSRSTGAFRFVNYGIRPIGAVMGGMLGAAFGVRETLLFVTIAACAGVLWLLRTPILGLRDLPEPADLPARAAVASSA
jgi:MFS family permease